MQSTPQHVAVSALKGIVDPAIWKDDTIAVPLQVMMAKAPFWSADYEQYVRTLAPQMDYRVMDGVGHFLRLENPGAFNELLAAFLRKERLLKP
jgi:pimeloyl-ACP methyl ester carboxylesterase